MERSPQHDRELAVLREAVRSDDLERIRNFAAQTAAQLIEAARPQGHIDVVNGLARVAAVRLVASYFGVPDG
jgi:cytochrome P450